MKLSDYVADLVAQLGVKHVFMLTGGGAMHLNHSLGTHKDLECTFNHHEQACAIAAEAYTRLNNRIALVNVTSGPGGTNAITGVYGAFVDSIAMVVISGQVKYETTVKSTGLPLRQYGDQELDIIEVVRPITKYCAMVTDPKMIRYEVEKAFYLAQSGRPGPVWLDIPLDVQGAKIDPASLTPFIPPVEIEPWDKLDLAPIAKTILEKVQAAKRPVLYVGSGIRISKSHEQFIELVQKLGIPVVTAWNAHDVIWNDHPMYAGRPGHMGDRGGNFTAQNADLLLVLGSRLSIRQVSYNWKSFAREAYKIWVEIDELEFKKPSIKADMEVHADLAKLLPELLKLPYPGPTSDQKEWLAWCKERNRKYPVVLPEYWNKEGLINTYCFVDELFSQLKENQVVVSGNGSCCVIGFQAANLKKGQRLWTNSGCATMGYDLPGAIGAYKASGETIVCMTGDGSLMMNLQELETIVGNKMPIKLFLFNNNGYVSILQTHKSFFNGICVGGGPSSGVTFPSFKKIAAAFDIPYFSCQNHSEMKDAIESTLAVKDGPSICEAFLDETVIFAPKLSARQHPDGRITSPPLEDLSPFLPREELKENMLIPTQEE